MSRFQGALLALALIIGFLLRLKGINNPVADWHSFRQADTASVTRHLLLGQGSYWLPTYHDLSSLQSGLDNPQGLRLVEFPLYNFFCLLFFKVTNPLLGFSLEAASRLTSIIFSLISAFLIYRLSHRFTSRFWPSFLGLTVFLFLPFNIYYSRVILPEPTAITFMLAALFFFPQKWLLSGIFLAAAILIKPFTAIILFPPLLFLSFKYFPKKPSSLWPLFMFAAISLTPFIIWRLHISHYPEGIPYSRWLFFKQKQFLASNNWTPNPPAPFLASLIPFKPYWFRWLFYQRLGNLILGAFGLIPFFLGLAYRKRLSPAILYTFLAGIGLYFTIVAGGNIQHDYYQSLIIPFVAIITGFGLYYLINFVFTSQTLALLSTIILVVFTFSFSWFQIKDYYLINHPQIITAGARANQLIPQNALVIAPYNGDTAFLYQTHRSGWPLEIYDIPKLKKSINSPLYLVSVNFDGYTQEVASQYPIVEKTDNYIILNLNDNL